jgi:hypothetical protein
MPANTDLIQLIDAQKNLMIAVSTGGPRIQETNDEYKQRRLEIKAALLRKQLDDPNPYSDLWAWYGKWSSGDLPSYQSRRLYIGELYQPLLDKLEIEDIEHPAEPTFEDTGWVKVDRGVDSIRVRLENAKTEQEYQTVGFLCRETLISLAQSVYDPFTHKPIDGTEPSQTDAYRMLEAYFTAELAGRANEALRRHAKASLVLANALQHDRTARFRDAALCAEATRTVVNIAAIISGKRDPEYPTGKGKRTNSSSEDDIAF